MVRANSGEGEIGLLSPQSGALRSCAPWYQHVCCISSLSVATSFSKTTGIINSTPLMFNCQQYTLSCLEKNMRNYVFFQRAAAAQFPKKRRSQKRASRLRRGWRAPLQLWNPGLRCPNRGTRRQSHRLREKELPSFAAVDEYLDFTPSKTARKIAFYQLPLVKYSWMEAAALRPAPMARITVAPPVTMSPPAKTPRLLVRNDFSSASM